ncbi:MAG: PAS domain-containing sensor histidine kinase [Alphaproteobacteria bacterium]|nr:PAS domain-containing sensor histidine kinase [Alphaproteobacteria bacterium]
MATDSAVGEPKPPKRAIDWMGRVGLGRKLAFALALAALGSGIATYVVITSKPPFGPDPATVLLLLNLDLILLLLLGALVARRLVALWAERRRGMAGARLHVRFVALFSLLAVTPTIVVAVFSFLFFNFGIQNWFSETVRTAVFESRAVAHAYLEEHQNVIRADISAMAADLNRDATSLIGNPQRFNQVVTAQARLRALSEAIVFDLFGRVLARSAISFALEFDSVPEWAMAEARAGTIPVLTSETDDRVRALIRLDDDGNAFLYVGRFIDPRVIGHLERTERAVQEYSELEGRRSGIQITFALVFLVVALLLLLAAVWAALLLANRLARPLGGLVEAAERIRGGDLGVRVDERQSGDEMDTLSRAFNRMTRQLQSQRSELVEANRQLEARRRFTETVLAGVSAGVVGVDRDGAINLPNRSASELLGVDLDQWIGADLASAVPEMTPMLERARSGESRTVEGQIEIQRQGRKRTLIVRVAAERSGEATQGYVVTFDDVTELLSAQRKAAWSDVARRIAHEIKNPLTPIQLSAERLKRRYGKEITSDPDTFQLCTDTIIRQVGDIGRMVDEFSAFARMPAPVMRAENVGDICRQAAFLQRSARPDLRFGLHLPEGDATLLRCDRRQVTQALTNLLQNAADSIDGRAPADGPPQGAIDLRLVDDATGVRIVVEDNGRGLPQEGREQLTEPYVTTRAKGTGLGLAIVKKIMEDHGGDLLLDDREGGGARITLVFPRHAVALADTGAAVESSLTEADTAARKAGTHGA